MLVEAVEVGLSLDEAGAGPVKEHASEHPIACAIAEHASRNGSP